MRLTLYRNGLFHGRVVDAESGAPVVQFTVHEGLVTPESSHSGDRFVNSEGRFQLKGLRRGEKTSRLSFTFIGDGYVPYTVEDIEILSEDKAPEYVVELSRGKNIDGYVVDAATHQAIEGATVRGGYRDTAELLWDHQFFRRIMVNVQEQLTDADGHFRITEDQPCTLLVEALGYGRVAVRPSDREDFVDLDGRVRIALSAEATLACTVLERGVPQSDARVALIRVAPEDLGRQRPEREWFGPSESASEREQGRFAWERLTAGTYLIELQRSASDDAGQHTTRVRRRVDVPSGSTVESTIGEDIGKLKLTGRILDAGGAPQTSAYIRLAPHFETRDSFVTYTKDDGKFRMIGLRAGTYDVQFYRWRQENRGVTHLQPIELTRDREIDFTADLPVE